MKKNNFLKKLVIILMIIFFIIPNNVYCRKEKFIIQIFKKISKTLPTKSLKKLSKQIKIKNLDKYKSVIKKIPDVKVTPESLKILGAIDKIASKGKVAQNLLKYSKHPDEVIKFYTRYGDDFLDIATKVKKGITKIDFKSINVNSKIPKKLLPEIKKLKNDKIFADKFINFTKKVGKYGLEKLKKLLKYAKKHPKKSLLYALAGGFIIDPEKTGNLVESAMKRVGYTAEKIVEHTTKGVIKGMGDAGSEAIKNTTKLIFSKLSYFISAIILFTIIIMFLKHAMPFKKLFFLPFKIVRAKIEKKIDAIEEEIKKSSDNEKFKDKKSNNNEKEEIII